MKDQGKGVIGMKIMGQGDLRDKPGEAVRFAMGSGVLDAITVGAEPSKSRTAWPCTSPRPEPRTQISEADPREKPSGKWRVFLSAAISGSTDLN